MGWATHEFFDAAADTGLHSTSIDEQRSKLCMAIFVTAATGYRCLDRRTFDSTAAWPARDLLTIQFADATWNAPSGCSLRPPRSGGTGPGNTYAD